MQTSHNKYKRRFGRISNLTTPHQRPNEEIRNGLLHKKKIPFNIASYKRVRDGERKILQK